MPNGNEMLNELDFDKKIDGMDSLALTKFIARQVYETSQDLSKVVSVVEIHETKITAIETTCKERAECASGTSKKTVGISALGGGFVVAVIDAVLKRFGVG